MNKLPLVSVIIPTYNRPKLLRETIESVLAQTHPALECIVVDDGSTDDTPRMLAEYARNFPGKLIPIRQENRGGTAARNTGARAARGRFLNFLDHDDLFLPEKIQSQVKVFDARPALGLVHCGYYRIDKDGRYLDKRIHLPEGDVRVRLAQGCFLWSGAPLIRRECLDLVGLFNEEAWSSDADMWLRIAFAGYHFGCVQEPMGCYRMLLDSAMADVSRTERMDIPNMERIFSDPSLPHEVRTVRDKAFLNQRFWLAFRYYTVMQWEDGKRNLEEAICISPGILDDADALIHRMVDSVLDLRVEDSLALADYVMEHLPAAVDEVVRPRRKALYGLVHMGLAFRNYCRGRIEDAGKDFQMAILLMPQIASAPEYFIHSMVSWAHRAPGSPMQYLELVLNNLPPEAQLVLSRRKAILAELAVGLARREFWFGQRRHVPGLLMKAFRYRRSWLKKPRKLAQFALSLPHLLAWRIKETLVGARRGSLDGCGDPRGLGMDLPGGK